MQKKKLGVISVKLEGDLKDEFETWLWVHHTSKTDAIREMILALIRPEQPSNITSNITGAQEDVKKS
jgi:hypothetical protein